MTVRTQTCVWAMVLAIVLVWSPPHVRAHCGGLGETPVIKAIEGALYDTNALSQLEPKAISTSNGLASRSGGTLRLKLSKNLTVTFVDKGDCSNSKAVNISCETFSFLGTIPSLGYSLVFQALPEGGHFLLVDDNTSYIFSFGDLPHFSPDGNTIVLFNNNDSGDSGTVEVWLRARPGFVLHYKGSPLHVERNTLYTHYYLENWISNRALALCAEVFSQTSATPKHIKVIISSSSRDWKSVVVQTDGEP